MLYYRDRNTYPSGVALLEKKEWSDQVMLSIRCNPTAYAFFTNEIVLSKKHPLCTWSWIMSYDHRGIIIYYLYSYDPLIHEHSTVSWTMNAHQLCQHSTSVQVASHLKAEYMLALTLSASSTRFIWDERFWKDVAAIADMMSLIVVSTRSSHSDDHTQYSLML